MYKKITVLFSAAILVLLQGCASQRVASDFDQNYDFSTLKSYAFSENQQVIASNVEVSQLTMKRTKNAINNNLQQNFESSSAADSDFLVRYHIILKDEMDVRSYNSMYGYGYSAFDYDGFGVGVSNTQVRNYTKGTLIIDIVDSKTNEHIWRGSTYARTSANKAISGAKQTEVINTAVNEILAEFPPKSE